MSDITWLELPIALSNIHIILVSVFSGKIRIRMSIFTSLVILLPCLVAVTFFPKHPIGMMSGILCNVLYCVIPILTISNIKMLRIIFITLFYVGISSTLILSCVWVARIIDLDFNSVLIMCALLQLLFFFICIIFAKRLVFHRMFEKIEILPKRFKVMLIASIWISDALATLLPVIFSELPRSRALTVTESLAAITIIFIGVMWPLIITANVSAYTYKNTLENLEIRIQEQVHYYELINRANEDIRKFQHDYKNMELGLVSILQKEGSHKALQYLRKWDVPIKAKQAIYETGNFIADALLSDKHDIAVSINTAIIFKGVIPNNLIDATDVCIIMGNALDNALEACSKIPIDVQKIINISAYFNNGFLFLTISNPTLQEIQIKNGYIATSKQDKGGHGMGLPSIRSSVKRYHGVMKLSCVNKLFIMEITMDFNRL